MRRSTPTLHGWVLALAAAGALTGCSDSNDGTGPSTLPPPTGVTVTQTSLTAATVAWTAASGATGYLVQRASSDNPGTFATLGSGPVSGTSYDDSGLNSSLTYSYQVASVSASDTSGYTTAVTFTPGLKSATITGPVTASRTLYADTVYTLSGYVKVQNGATLTIQPGTRIIGDTTQAGSSLWILRGAKIDAQGAANAPIVFTSARSQGNRKPGDWGGLIIIGNGIINRTGTTILTEGGAAGQAENYAGGTDNSDNSGTLRYVRVEFAGYDISNGAGQELNAISFYAVGRGTTREYVQTMSGLDDSFEHWGGAVDGRYLVSYESGDDHFDWTEGYQGRNQFLIAFQSQRLVPAPGAGVFSSDPRGFEGDGCEPTLAGCTLTDNSTSAPYSMPVWANFTFIGPGQLASIPSDGNGAVFRRGTGGTLFNGIMGRWKGIALNIRDAWTDSLFEQHDSLNIANLVLAQNGFNFDTVGAGFAQDTKFGPANAIQAFASNVAVDTLLGLSLNPAALDWTPKAGSPATLGGSAQVPAHFNARTGGFFGGQMEQTTYLGAADPSGSKWWQGWTAYNIN
jgi:hypothetical protein